MLVKGSWGISRGLVFHKHILFHSIVCFDGFTDAQKKHESYSNSFCYFVKMLERHPFRLDIVNALQLWQ